MRIVNYRNYQLIFVAMFSTLLLTCVALNGCGGGDGGDRGTGGTGSLLDGQTEFKGSLPALSAVTYQTKEGETLTEEFAFEGWVSIQVQPATSESLVRDTVKATGGTVVDAIPLIGAYIASVPKGQEAAFISTLLTKNFVLNAAPASPVVPATTVESVIIDSFQSSPSTCKDSHGNHVEAVAQRGGESVEDANISPEIIFSIGKVLTEGTAPHPITRTMVKRLEGTAGRDERIVINLSRQSPSSAKGDQDQIRAFCGKPATANDPRCRRVQAAQVEFFTRFLSALNELPQEAQDSAIVVLSAGNAGVDLTLQLKALQQQWPKAAKRVKIVGSTDTAGDILRDHNFASDGIVFARGKQVKTLAGQTCDGTSFAAPEVTRILEIMWGKAPSLTSEQVLILQRGFEMWCNTVSEP